MVQCMYLKAISSFQITQENDYTDHNINDVHYQG